MKSRISFIRLVCLQWKKLNWLTVLTILAFLFLLPFRIVMQMEYNRLQWGYASYTDMVGFSGWESMLLLFLLAIVYGVISFSYLHDPVELDFYHSLPIRREKLFAVNYLSSVCSVSFAYVLGQVLTVLVGCCYHCMTLSLLWEIFLATVEGILCFLCMYTTAVGAMLLTGNTLTGLLAVGASGAYVPALLFTAQLLIGLFWGTQLEAFDWMTGTNWLAYTSPWGFCLFGNNTGVMGATGIRPTLLDLLSLFLLAAILIGICLALYRVRKTEVAGEALAFRFTEPIIKLMVAVPVALVAAMVANMFYYSVGIELLFLLVFGVFSCMVMEFIYRRDIRLVCRGKGQLLATVVLSALIFVFFRFDLSGFNTYLPGVEELEGMSVKTWSYDTAFWDEETKTSYWLGTKEWLDQLETDQVTLLYQLAENGVENAKCSNPNNPENTEENCTTVFLKYRLKNGKEVYRTYLVETALYESVMKELYQTEEYKEAYYPIYTWDDGIADEIQYMHIMLYGYSVEELFGEAAAEDETETAANEAAVEDETVVVSFEEEDYVAVTIPASRYAKVLAAYREDLQTIAYEEVYPSDGYISILLGEGREVALSNYPITLAFAHTMALLEELYYQYS